MGAPISAIAAAATGSEPSEWFVAFHRDSGSRVLSFLAFGEFKHVSAFGYCPGVKVWLVYDVTWTRTWLRLVAHDAAGTAALAEWTRGCEILKLSPQGRTPPLRARIGFFCVPSIINLLGLRCVAVTPGQLYRHILRLGGQSISAAIRPDTPAPAG